MGWFTRDDPKHDPKQKPKADFSNVESGSSSTAPRPAAPVPPSIPTPQVKTYVVVKGDNLSKIAKQQYGRAEDWRKIYEANKDTIKNPDLIYPGQSLKIPQ
jgi:nucleoid-associated protein YgaU